MGEPGFPQRIKAILCRIQSGKYNYQEIVELVKISRVIVTSHLARNKKHTYYLCYKNGFSLADLAYDSIGELFEKSADREFKNLKSFFTSIKKNVCECPAFEIYSAYKSLLLRITEAQLTRLFAQLDPNGFRIIRNIKENLISAGFFKLIKKNNEFLLTVANAEQRNDLQYLSIDEITTDFILLNKNCNNTMQLLVSLHKVIVSQTNCRQEILLNDAVELFKRVYGISDIFNSLLDDDFEYHDYYSNQNELEIKEISIKVLAAIKEKILINYYAKGKITKEQANALYESICDLVVDWSYAGSSSESYFEYFKSHMDINKMEYQVHIKDKFEYLVKEARKQFVALIYSKT